MQKSAKRRIDWFRVVTTCFCLALVVIVIAFAVNIYQDINGYAGSTKEVEVTVPKGSSASDIADILKKDGIITSSLAYKTYTAFYKDLPSYHYGKFVLNSHMSYDEIAEALQKPSVFATTLSFTFPEGTTALKMAIMMSEGGMEFTVKQFMEACEEDYSESFAFCKLIDRKNDRFCTLEGYLFPSTYEFYYYDTPQTVIKKMLKAYEENVYTESVKEYLNETDMTLDDLMVLSSIVQKETPADMEVCGKIASVFLNRLAEGSPLPKLQSDTSTDWNGYPVGVIQYYYENYSDEQMPQSVFNAYDTYKVNGLPAGAICNPGADVVNAVISAPETDYYYFVSAKDGTTYFGRTLAEHEANIKKAGL